MNHNVLIENNRGNTPTTVSTEEESSNHETEDKKEKVDIQGESVNGKRSKVDIEGESENEKKDGDMNRNDAV